MRLEFREMPQIVRIELANTCNLGCPHCRHHSPQKRKSKDYPDYYKVPVHMTEEQVTAIIDEIAPYKPSVTLNVANEPLIAKSFPFAARYLKKKGLAGTFNTNGITLDEEVASFLVDVGFDSINVSIDALTPETLKKARNF